MPAISAIVDLEGLGYRQFYMPAVFHLTGLITLVERNFPYVATLPHARCWLTGFLGAHGGPHTLAGTSCFVCVRARDNRECLGFVAVINAPSIL